MNARIKFRKYGVMKYVGHLDMMRFFQKVIRKAEIPILFSEGFSPHMIMSFAAPLGIGLTSDAEYVDIAMPEEIRGSFAGSDYAAAMNTQMVEGVEILDIVILPEKAAAGMAAVSAADYLCRIEGEKEAFAAWDAFLAQPEIMVNKKSKKNERLVDIRPMIYESSVSDGLFLRVAQGSQENLKPELVLDAYTAFAHIPVDADRYRIHRKEVYQTDTESGELVPLIRPEWR